MPIKIVAHATLDEWLKDGPRLVRQGVTAVDLVCGGGEAGVDPRWVTETQTYQWHADPARRREAGYQGHQVPAPVFAYLAARPETQGGRAAPPSADVARYVNRGAALAALNAAAWIWADTARWTDAQTPAPAEAEESVPAVVHTTLAAWLKAGPALVRAGASGVRLAADGSDAVQPAAGTTATGPISAVWFRVPDGSASRGPHIPAGVYARLPDDGRCSRTDDFSIYANIPAARAALDEAAWAWAVERATAVPARVTTPAAEQPLTPRFRVGSAWYAKPAPNDAPYPKSKYKTGATQVTILAPEADGFVQCWCVGTEEVILCRPADLIPNRA